MGYFLKFLFIIFLAGHVYGDGGKGYVKTESMDEIARKKLEPRVSDKYYLGEYLIYDCKDKHFACVNIDSFKLCTQWRDEDKEERRRKLRCAPLTQFETQEKCFEAQYQQIYNQKLKLVCTNFKVK